MSDPESPRSPERDEPRLLIKKINRLAEELGEEVLRQGLSLTSTEPILLQARDKGLEEKVITDLIQRLAEIAELKLRLEELRTAKKAEP